MTNFMPYKLYMLHCLDELIDRYALQGPFVDIGCGTGEAALHLAAVGWSGLALDNSPTGLVIAHASLANYPGVEVVSGGPEDLSGRRFRTALLMDVLEHVADDAGFLRQIARLQPSGGALILTVPSNPECEWRWDDDYYGHLRRYRPADLERLLAESGYATDEAWDISFPFFWLLRRGFTSIQRAPVLDESPATRTRISSISRAWEMPVIGRLLSNVWLWKPALVIQKRFSRRIDRGCELMVLARRY
jgi:SAM-dependent methyltransferase